METHEILLTDFTPPPPAPPRSTSLRRFAKTASFTPLLTAPLVGKWIEKLPPNFLADLETDEPMYFKKEYTSERPGPRGVCSCCGSKIVPPTFEEYMAERRKEGFKERMYSKSTFDEHEWCGLCDGSKPGTPGVREPKLGEEWENTYGERIRVTQEYTCGRYGGWAMGVDAHGRQLGMRRGSVENGRWFPYKGPASIIDEVLLGT